MKNVHLYAVILAGGSGTRFWPLSRKKKPKQFLEIAGRQTLLDMTLNRIKGRIKPSHIFIVTNKNYKNETERQLKKFRIPKRNFLLEPSAKNTAPAIMWASSVINRRDKQAVTVVLPSDHLILDKARFNRCLTQAVSLARRDHLVTFGIVPTRAETGYGYLKIRRKKIKGRRFNEVERFTEKPSFVKAKRFVRSRNYLWNSGMFVWKTSVIIDEYKKHLPKVHRLIGTDHGNKKVLNNWRRLPTVSVDYGILERSDNVVAVEGKNLGWSDLGSWESLIESLKTDRNGNLFLSEGLDLGSKNTLVSAQDKFVATIGLKDCLIIDTPDALLVCRKDQSQKVKEVVEKLRKKRRDLV